MRTAILGRVISLSFVFLWCLPSNGQHGFYPGRIIDHNDTLRGLVKVVKKKSMITNMLFKTQRLGAETEVNPRMGTAVVMDGSRYYSTALLDGNALFFENLAHGSAATLLRQGNRFFIQKSDSALLLEKAVVNVGTRNVVKKLYVGTLASVMADCPAIFDRINRVGLAETDLISLVKRYNTCKNGSTWVFRETLPESKLYVGILLGVSNTRFRGFVGESSRFLYGYFEDEVISRVHLTGGLAFRLALPRIHPRLSFNPEARISISEFRDILRYDLSTYDLNEVTIRNSFISVPLLLNYRLSSKDRTGIFVNGGPMISYNMLATFQNIGSVSGSPNVRVIDQSLRLREMQFGLAGGFGYLFPVGQGLKAELRYEYYGIFNQDPNIRIEKSSWGFQLSYLLF
jgi:hypothetical protein